MIKKWKNYKAISYIRGGSMDRMKSINSGYTLVFLVIIISVMLTICGVILTIAAMNFKMKKVNSQAEKAFYLAEAGAEEAYTISKEYISLAIEYSNDKVKEFKENTEQDNYDELNEVFQSSFKDYIKADNLDTMTCIGLVNTLNDNSLYVVHEDGFPIVIAEIEEKTDYFLIEIRSVYLYEQVEKNTILELEINIPYYDAENNIGSLIEIINWKIEG